MTDTNHQTAIVTDHGIVVACRGAGPVAAGEHLAGVHLDAWLAANRDGVACGAHHVRHRGRLVQLTFAGTGPDGHEVEVRDLGVSDAEACGTFTVTARDDELAVTAWSRELEERYAPLPGPVRLAELCGAAAAARIAELIGSATSATVEVEVVVAGDAVVDTWHVATCPAGATVIVDGPGLGARHHPAAAELDAPQLGALLELTSGGSALVDASGIIRYMSPGGARILDADADTVVGTHFLDWCAPDTLDERGAVFAQILDTDAPIQHTARTRDGTLLSIRVRNQLADPDVAALAIAFDSYRATPIVELGGLSVDQLAESVPVGFIAVDDAGLVVAANEAAAELLSMERRSLIGRRCTPFGARDGLPLLPRHRSGVTSFGDRWLRAQLGDVTATPGRRIVAFVDVSADIAVRDAHVLAVESIANGEPLPVVLEHIRGVCVTGHRARTAAVMVVDAAGQVVAATGADLARSLRLGRGWRPNAWARIAAPDAFGVQIPVGHRGLEALLVAATADGEDRDDLLSAATLAAGVLATAVTRHVDAVRLDAHLRELSDARRELSGVIQRLSATTEQERARLAEQLHDHTLQPIAAATWLLRDAAEDGAPYAEPVLGLLDEAVTSSRNLLFDLRPPELDASGLAAAIERLLERTAAETGLSARLVTAGTTSVTSAADRARTAVYRATSELLWNVRKHAQASSVTVTLDVTDTTIGVVVDDDGVGVDQDQARARRAAGHLGLASLAETAAQLGGEFSIERRPGGGTSARFRVGAAAGDVSGEG